MTPLFGTDVVAAVGEGALAGLVDVDEFVDEFVVGLVVASEAVEFLYGFGVEVDFGHDRIILRADI
jgi:hypothetical protein